MEILLIIGLVAILVIAFGARALLFGDQSAIANRQNLARLITGGNQSSMLTDGSEMKGKTGKVHTVLKPSGKIIIDGQLYEASTWGEYLSAGTRIIVIGKAMGQTLRVRQLLPEDTTT